MPSTFELIGTDACGRRTAGDVKIKVEELLGKCAHRQSGHADMFEQDSRILHERNPRMKFMHPA